MTVSMFQMISLIEERRQKYHIICLLDHISPIWPDVVWRKMERTSVSSDSEFGSQAVLRHGDIWICLHLPGSSNNNWPHGRLPISPV